MSGIPNHINTELKQLKESFPSDHPTYQVANEASEEILFIFVNQDEKHKLRCSFTELTVSQQPSWSTDSSNSIVIETLEELSQEEFHTKFKLTAMVRFIVFRLCNKFNISLPDTFYALGRNLPPEDDTDDSDSVNSGSTEEVVDVAGPSSTSPGLSKTTPDPLGTSTKDDLPPEAMQPHDPPKNSNESEPSKSAGTIRASKRLMKEYQSISQSKYVKDGFYKVELHEDNLFEWDVEIFKVDSDSVLHHDLEMLKSMNKRHSVGLAIRFNEKFPFEPPFVRVAYPVLRGGYVLEGGAICLELLTTDGWSSVYTMESVILQVMAAFAKGFAHVQMGVPTSSLNYPNALRSFSRMNVMHERSGWYTPPSSEG